MIFELVIKTTSDELIFIWDHDMIGPTIMKLEYWFQLLLSPHQIWGCWNWLRKILQNNYHEYLISFLIIFFLQESNRIKSSSINILMHYCLNYCYHFRKIMLIDKKYDKKNTINNIPSLPWIESLRILDSLSLWVLQIRMPVESEGKEMS